MLEVYRVKRRFQWDGKTYAPNPANGIDCDSRLRRDKDDNPIGGMVGTGCNVKNCPLFKRCDIAITRKNYGGDVWIVESGHPRKESIISSRFVVGDASLPSADDILAKRDKVTVSNTA